MKQHRNHADLPPNFQSKREMRRRLRQIRAGQLQAGDEARYAAFGLIAPPSLETRHTPLLIRPANG